MLVDGWLVGCPNEVCIFCCIGLYLFEKDLLILSATTFNCLSLLSGSHSLLMLKIREKRG
jgi:hypothetical protein